MASQNIDPTAEEIDKAAEWCTSDSDGCGDCPHGDDLCAEMFARAYLAARKEIEALADLAEERRG